MIDLTAVLAILYTGIAVTALLIGLLILLASCVGSSSLSRSHRE